MKTSIALLLTASLLTLAGCDKMQPSKTDSSTADTSAAIATETAPGKVLATVNGSAITQPVFDVYMAVRNAQKPGANPDRNSVLEELISLELMRQEGVSEGLGSKEAVIATLDQQTRTVLASAAIKDFIAKNPISDEAVRKLYDSQINKTGNEYKARHILVKTREEAADIIKQLDNGGNFEELAKAKSTGPSGKSGGQLGWFSPAQMVKPFSDATAQLEKGAYTKEPVQTQFGWHIIMLEDIRKITPPPFEDIKDRLKLMAANQELQAHVQQLRQAADIEITGSTADEAPAVEAPAASDDQSTAAEQPAAEKSADATEKTPAE